ncbi:response regulator [Acetobacterium carbinolicum]|jgi:two-component system chemotaxis response regulator CheY|uniref:response regulator n=1 Tax=Acetobacterium TaxID=33951 RepID=UPI000DBECBD9|nr:MULTISPECIES: response regulator [unclassified Acetobacterium]AWW25756.1 response regulator [Acetobacterium sp. KB-1]MDK2941424.1 two-component system, chemotaxis family, chemotaxis protein CheY [Acetobacterium sp.]MDZ5726588.1 response regulator [Acetobacterium sp. K1/6]
MKRILIVEDDLISRKFLSKFMNRYGDCDLVVDGLEAIDAYLLATKEGVPYDLICLDVMMPKIDGIQVLKTIRDLEKQNGVNDNEKCKIVMTTVLGEILTVQSAFDFGCNAYASKPLDIAKLTEVLGKIGFIEERL